MSQTENPENPEKTENTENTDVRVDEVSANLALATHHLNEAGKYLGAVDTKMGLAILNIANTIIVTAKEHYTEHPDEKYTVIPNEKIEDILKSIEICDVELPSL